MGTLTYIFKVTEVERSRRPRGIAAPHCSSCSSLKQEIRSVELGVCPMQLHF